MIGLAVWSPIAPDPFIPMMPVASSGPLRQPSVSMLNRRRAEMLAVTRRHIATAGHDGFTLREISEECGVSEQTIYNCFGRRQDLLIRALNEHTTMTQQAAAQSCGDEAIFLALADIYYYCALETPDFLRQVVTTALSTEYTRAAMQRHGTDLKAGILRDFAKAGVLRRGTDAEALAAQITRLSMIAIYEWSRHGDAEDLRSALVHGARLLMLGSLTVSGGTAIETWLPFAQ